MNPIPQEEYKARRQRLATKMNANSIAIIPSALEYFRAGNTHYPFRQSSDFYYLTGFSETNAIAVIITDNEQSKYILFNRPNDPEKEVWTGAYAGQKGAVDHFGADEAYPITEFATQLPDLLSGIEHVYYSLGNTEKLDTTVISALQDIRKKVRTGVNTPHEFVDLEQLIHDMRLIKSPEEIAMMRRAAQISAQAHCRAMRACHAGMYEYEIEAELTHDFLKNGSRSAAYPSIVGGGKNACVLHYTDNDSKLHDGDLLLIDAACEYQMYASDITRTFPINGKFRDRQRDLYEVVLKAQLAGIAAVKTDNTWEEVNHTIDKILMDGLAALNIFPESLRDVYMHSAGHWLGLDTHDVGIYKTGDAWNSFKPGMVLTVEPGLYIQPNKKIDKKWWHIGIRIEDDILVTESGNEVLSKDAPKSIDEIETLMAG